MQHSKYMYKFIRVGGSEGVILTRILQNIQEGISVTFTIQLHCPVLWLECSFPFFLQAADPIHRSSRDESLFKWKTKKKENISLRWEDAAICMVACVGMCVLLGALGFSGVREDIHRFRWSLLKVGVVRKGIDILLDHFVAELVLLLRRRKDTETLVYINTLRGGVSKIQGALLLLLGQVETLKEASPVSAPCAASAVWGSWPSGTHPGCPLPSPSPGPCSTHRRSLSGQHRHCTHNRRGILRVNQSNSSKMAMDGRVVFVLLHVKKPRAEGSYLQCTVMGWFPDCCCCFCTAAIKLIMPLPSVGMPTSGQPWKWNWRTARALFSCDRGQWRKEQINHKELQVLTFVLFHLLPCYWWPGGHAPCSSRSHPPFLSR